MCIINAVYSMELLAFCRLPLVKIYRPCVLDSVLAGLWLVVGWSLAGLWLVSGWVFLWAVHSIAYGELGS